MVSNNANITKKKRATRKQKLKKQINKSKALEKKVVEQFDEIFVKKLEKISDQAGKEADKKSDAIYNIKTFLINLSTTLLVVFVCLTFVFGIYIQVGEGMYPRLRDGDLVLYYRIDKNYSIGDVLTFEVDGVRYTGRYVAMAGDKIDITEQGQFLVNGSVQQEEVFYATFKDESGIEYPYTVSQDSLFVLGDFRTNAIDSRVFGAVAISEIDGKVITIIRRRGI